MADDFDKLAELIRNGYSVDEALNHVTQTVDSLPSATTTVEGGVVLATDAEVTTGTTSKVPPVSALVAHEGVCKAWVSFNGTGTVAIDDSFNVTSITDNGGTGDYTVNFTVDMGSVDYVALGSFNVTTSSTNWVLAPHTYATSSVRMKAFSGSGGQSDATDLRVFVIGDQ